MSIFNLDNFVEIKLYYVLKKVNGINRLIIVEDSKAEKMLENEIERKSVQILNTRWKPLTWKEQNEVMKLSSQIDATTGESQFDFVAYRDAIIKKCLKEWDARENGQVVPVTPQKIDSLPATVATSLFKKFEEISTYTEEEIKN